MANFKRPTQKKGNEFGNVGKIAIGANCNKARRQQAVVARAGHDGASKISNKYIGKLYSISEALYLRDIVETNHAVNSGTTSIEVLKMKYAKYIK